MPDYHPADVYRQRQAECAAADSRLERGSIALSVARGVVLAVFLVVAWLVTESRSVHAVWLGVPTAVFVALAVVHWRVEARRRRLQRLGALFRRGLDRLADAWQGNGQVRVPADLDEHPYAIDLELFGPGSLFELLCTVRTRIGEDTLAEWLLQPAPREDVRERQAAVAELATRRDLWERWALLGDDRVSELECGPLVRWAESPPRHVSAALRLGAGLVTAISGAALAGALVGWWRATPVLFAVVVHLGFARAHRSWVGETVRAVSRPAGQLALVAALLGCLERQRFVAPLLVDLRADLLMHGTSPASAVARLGRLVALLDSRRNMAFAPVAALLLWTFHLACAVERWRAAHGPRVRVWFDALGRFEALLALSTYAWEHPCDPFPDLEQSGPLVVAEDLVHPLLSTAEAVRNDLALDTDTRLLIVSGSNMSGKTTLMRSLGVNVVLAQAGAPVRAAALRLSPCAVAASIASRESLRRGRSRFFAEMTRLRQVVDLCGGEVPVLFLLDELLSGTNSHDREVGAELVLRGLLERGAVGLVTTHDLALARLEDTLAPRVANVHFEDQVVDGRLHFDFRLRPGTVTSSNALELMRAFGLVLR